MIFRQPRVSVIISSYNRPNLVTDAILSCKDQDEDFECIVADDASNEETLTAIQKAIAGDPRFLLLSPAAGTPTGDDRARTLRYCCTINAGLRVVRGRYLTYIPDDDYLGTGGLNVRADVLDANPDVHVVYGKMRSLSYDGPDVWDSNGRPIPGRTQVAEGNIDPVTGRKVDIASWWPGMRSPIVGIDHGQIMHRRECLEEMGGPLWWPEGPVDMPGGPGDALFFRRLDELGHKALAVDAITNVKRYHAMNFDKARFSDRRE